MLVPSMHSMAEVMAESGYPEETIFDLGISGEIIFLVIVPEIGACRVPEMALSHFMAGADEFSAHSMPSLYQPEIKSGHWTIKRDRLRVLAESWRNWGNVGKALFSRSLRPHTDDKTPEQISAWWDATMDASVWWVAESISPTNAAMLLARWNPNLETIESVTTSSSDEMGPADLRRLQNIFEGADPGVRRTLQDWIEYAKQRKVKIHSWVDAWVATPPQAVSQLSPNENASKPSPPAKGLSTKEILIAFSIALDEKRAKTVKTALDNTAKWVEESKLSSGTKGGRHLTRWSPVSLALDLLKREYATVPHLSKCFGQPPLKDWRDEWQDRMELGRD